VINLGFIIFWLFSIKKKRIIISLIPIVLGWGFLGMNVQFAGEKISDEDLGKSIKLLSYNIQGFSQDNVIEPDSQRQNLFEFIRKEAPDIICLQEYTVSTRTKALTENNIRNQFSGTPYFHGVLVRQRYGVATFSKYPMIHKEVVFEDNTTNACICSDLLIDGDTVRVYNIHLKSVGFHRSQKQFLDNAMRADYDRTDIHTIRSIMKRISAASFARTNQVSILLEHLRHSPYPVIVCGDFNDPPTSSSYRKLRGDLKDAFIESGSGRSTTYSIGSIASLRIDCILYSDVFKAYNYDTPRVFLSDHLPVTSLLVKE
jgi:endonuclease/exonuclease/phosphatase family metal-dependent hydrolase